MGDNQSQLWVLYMYILCPLHGHDQPRYQYFLAFINPHFFGRGSKLEFQKSLRNLNKSFIFLHLIPPNSTYQEISKSIEKLTKLLT